MTKLVPYTERQTPFPDVQTRMTRVESDWRDSPPATALTTSCVKLGFPIGGC
jgi:hypothetical protein